MPGLWSVSEVWARGDMLPAMTSLKHDRVENETILLD